MENMNSKWSEEDIKRFKKLINEKRQEVISSVIQSKKNTKNMSESNTVNPIYSSHMADAGSDQMEREKEFFWLNRDTQYLQFLDRALDMIKDGTFGICRTCGEKIVEERLVEVPHTVTCFKCKMKSKNNNKQS